MAKLIALRSGFNDGWFDAWRSNFSSHLKQQALLFDQIGIFQLHQRHKIIGTFKPVFQKTPENNLASVSLELDWLEENGIIFELTVREEIANQAAEYFFKLNSSKKEKEIGGLISKLSTMQKIEIKDIEDMAYAIDSIKEQDAIILRLMSLIMETTKRVTAVTTLPYTEYIRELPNSNKSDVAQIVISSLPLPDNTTSWEQIIDYRNDPGNQKNLLTLRRWIRKISTEELSKAEIEEEIEWLINEFQEHMRYHKIKANTETLEVLVKAPLEIIEDLVRLKLSKIPEPFFALKKKQLLLMDAEITAPGKEMAYIIKSREAFQSQE